ncbi:precorrin-2 C(20)-methyltransferase [Gloeocapsa sp. PCC 73106]|uniref:precorrin-2 C(20)-methyltransferase n=1 Tax=Gloeocapsa sp. PCC 73106 TaxID=102232 RepID=UPI0002ABED63|nr:precorrin-2 C(20)-methyltransferase [Gloeocapsa sp. PCC 73106]ELR99633.1 precorrin-2 C20-methyltransferase [Gloeocapsa sp. PCC 73106]
MGILYGISVGTGDPELITMKGLKILQSAPIVAFPAGIGNKPGIAAQIVADWLKPEQKTVALDFPYVQDLDILTQAWRQGATRVWQYLENNQNVAFACEGDVSFYSTFTYLAQTLKEMYPQAQIETIPGVSSPFAAAAALGIPLTIREQRLAILPALYRVSELELALSWAETIVLLKVSSVYNQVWQILAQYGLLHQAMVVERASTPFQVIYRDLSDRPDLELSYFSLLIINNLTLT